MELSVRRRVIFPQEILSAFLQGECKKNYAATMDSHDETDLGGDRD